MSTETVIVCLVFLPLIFILMLWVVVVNRRRRKALEQELIAVKADYASFRNMYGPNLMSVKPDTTGSVSDAVLVDLSGWGIPSDFVIGYYNWNNHRWTFDPGDMVRNTEYPDIMEHGKWYRLPLKKYEEKRLSR